MMNRLREFGRRVAILFGRKRFDSDLEEEMRAHVRMQAEENRENGMDAEAAQYAARRQFGNATFLKELSGEMWGWSWLGTVSQDVKYALRAMLKNPGFSAVAILSLGLGVGANTALFSVMDALILRALPVRDPSTLIEFTRLHPAGAKMTNLPYQVFLEFSQNHTVLSDVFAVNQMEGALQTAGISERATAQQVSGSFFPALGVKAFMGRTIGPEDDRAGTANHVAVLSHAFWTRRFGRDPSALGTTVLFDGRRLTIVGIMPPEFFGVDRSSLPDLWQPMALNSKPFEVWILGRLRRGVSMPHARAELDPLFRRALTAAESGQHFSARERSVFLAQRLMVAPATNGTIAVRWKYWEYSGTSKILLGLSGLVLLIACANLANLLAARSTARSREIGVRLAIGASRGRLIRQFMTENILLSLFGGALGLLIASWGHGIVLRFLVRDLQAASVKFQLDYRVLAFGLALSIGTVLLFGLFPAIQASAARQLHEARVPLAKTLLVVQVALSVVLTIHAGLSARTLRNLLAADLGFERENLILVPVDCPPDMPAHEAQRFWRQAMERVSALPGVKSAAVAADSVFGDRSYIKTFRIKQQQQARDAQVSVNLVDRGFFATVGIPLLMGREFGDQDREKSARVAVVNQTFARQQFGNRSPIGEHLGSGRDGSGDVYEIVGVAGDARFGRLREPPQPMVYQARLQEPYERLQVLHIRTAVDPASLVSTIRRQLTAIGEGVLISDPKTFPEVFYSHVRQDRMLATVAGAFAVLALLLASIGVYGAIAFRVARRTGEIGIRVALGARRGRVLWVVMREMLLVFGAGAVIGTIAAVAIGRLMRSMLFGLAPWDPVTIAAAITMLLMAGALASYVPARRALRIDATQALRYE